MIGDRVFDAIEFAARAHRGQFRKGTDMPYIVHPLDVMQILIASEASEDAIIAGLLHDTVEDTEVTLDDIRERFGARIASIVAEVTTCDDYASWEEKKRHTVESVRHASPDALMVEFGDKLDNIRTIRSCHAQIGERVWERFRGTREQTEWYYRSLVEAFSGNIRDEVTRALFEGFRMNVDAAFGTADGTASEQTQTSP